MKNILIAIVFTALCVSVHAQSVNIEPIELKGVDMSNALNATVVGARDGLNIVVTNYGWSNNSPLGSGIVIYGIDANGKVQKKLLVSKERECTLVTATAVGDTVYMLATGFEKGGLFDFYRLKADLNNWNVVGTAQTFYKHKNSKSDWIDWTVAASPDKHILAIAIQEYAESSRIAKVFGKKDEEVDALFAMDNRLNILWQRDDLPGWYNSLIVDDDETVHSLLAGAGNERTYFIFANHRSFGDEIFVDSLDRTDIQACRLLNCTDGHFVAGGTLGEDRRGLRNTQYSGMFALAYNSKTGKLTFNRMTFNETEVATFNNVVTSERLAEREVEGLSIGKGSPTPFGGILQLCDKMVKIIVQNGIHSYYYYLNGSLMAAIDTNANFLWRVPIRNGLCSTDNQSLINQAVIFENGKTLVLQTESSRNSTSYNNTDKAHVFMSMTSPKSMVAVYSIDSNGTTTKTTWPTGKAFYLAGNPHRIDDNLFFTIMARKKVTAIRLK